VVKVGGYHPVQQFRVSREPRVSLRRDVSRPAPKSRAGYERPGCAGEPLMKRVSLTGDGIVLS
jgi:hypothetical protein